MFFLLPPVVSLVLGPAAPPEASGATPPASKRIEPSKCDEPIGYAVQFTFQVPEWYGGGSAVQPNGHTLLFYLPTM